MLLLQQPEGALLAPVAVLRPKEQGAARLRAP